MLKTNYNVILFYLVFFICSVIFSFLINSLFLKFSKNLGVRQSLGESPVIRWGSQAKPSLGGISFYISFLLALSSYAVFIDTNKLFLNAEFIGILISCTTGFLMGLSDDAYDTKPFLKLAVQFTCGMILIASGIYINIFESMLLNYCLTLFWVIGIMNSINMLDNMDAITTVVSVSIMFTALTLILLNRDLTNIHCILIFGLLASLIGFLFFNWHPSKMYMGDTGSQLLGIFLAAIGIIYFWNLRYVTPQSDSVAEHFIVPMLVFIIPLVDTTTVVINRLSKKSSPFIGGKDHTTHALAYIGLSDAQVAMVLGLISALSSLLVIIIHSFLIWSDLLTYIFGAYILLVAGSLFYLTRLAIKKQG